MHKILHQNHLYQHYPSTYKTCRINTELRRTQTKAFIYTGSRTDQNQFLLRLSLHDQNFSSTENTGKEEHGVKIKGKLANISI